MSQPTTSLTDPRLKISPKLFYPICVPLRLSIAMLFLLSIIPIRDEKWRYILLIYFFLISSAFVYKYATQPHKLWKPYLVSIVLYILCFVVTLFSNRIKNSGTIIGLLLVMDVVIGMTAKHILDT